MHLEDDYLEILAATRRIKKLVTSLRRAARKAPLAPLPPTWWAELTVAFVDELQRPGCFFDRWRPLGAPLDVDPDSQLPWPVATELPVSPGAGEIYAASEYGYAVMPREVPEVPSNAGVTEELLHKALPERLREILKRWPGRIQRAEEELRRDRRSAPLLPMSSHELIRRREAIDDLKNAHVAAARALQRRIYKHGKHLGKRRARIIKALVSKGPALRRQSYRSFALAAMALWCHWPPRDPADLVSPPETIAATLSGWRWRLSPDSVLTVRKRVGPVGPEGAEQE
jgi:hypothetical protein